MSNEERNVVGLNERERKIDISRRGSGWILSEDSELVIVVADLKMEFEKVLPNVVSQTDRVERTEIPYKGLLDFSRTKTAEIAARLDTEVTDGGYVGTPIDHIELSIEIKKLGVLAERLGFVRPAIQEDIDYRKDLSTVFPRRLYESTLRDRGLRLYLHGQPIYLAEDTLKSGALTSPIIRGLSLGTDVGPDYVCAATNGWCGDAINYAGACDVSVPLGVVYVIKPSEEDRYVGQPRTRDVDLGSDRLIKVLAAPEMIETVRKWAVAGGLDPDIVIEFNAYPEEVERLPKKEEISGDGQTG